jgi:hypothetical protein
MREPTRSKVLAIGFIVLWVSIFVPNVPVTWSRRMVGVSRKLLFPVHVVLGLGGTYGMGMFAKPSRRGNACLFTLGFHRDGSASDLVYPPPIRDCVDPGVRVRQNANHHAFYKYFSQLVFPGSIYRIYRQGKTPKDFQRDLGEMFCGWSGSRHHRVDQLFVGLFQERYYPAYRLTQRDPSVRKLKRLVRGFGYDCSRHALVSIESPTVFAALARDHPAIYDVFRDYQAQTYAESITE